MAIASLLRAKFTANARNIAAIIAVCAGAYGLTLVLWLEQTQQRAVELQPRDAAPDFLITEARYLKYQPANPESNANEQILKKEQTFSGPLKIDIKSTTLAHFSDTKTSRFENPVVEFRDDTKQSWLITANEANAISTTTLEENITLKGNVTITGVKADTILVTSDLIEIDPTTESISSEVGIAMTFPNGNLTAGKFMSNMNSGRIVLSDNVKAIYMPTIQK